MQHNIILASVGFSSSVSKRGGYASFLFGVSLALCSLVASAQKPEALEKLNAEQQAQMPHNQLKITKKSVGADNQPVSTTTTTITVRAKNKPTPQTEIQTYTGKKSKILKNEKTEKNEAVMNNAQPLHSETGHNVAKIGQTQYLTPSDNLSVIQKNYISKTQLKDLHILIGCEKQNLCSYKVVEAQGRPKFWVYVPQNVWAQIQDKANAQAYFEQVIQAKLKKAQTGSELLTASVSTPVETAAASAPEAQKTSGFFGWLSNLFGAKEPNPVPEENYSPETIRRLHNIEVHEPSNDALLQKYNF